MAYPHESKYKEEDNWGEFKSCGDNPYTGVKSSNRLSDFCDPVTMQKTLDVTGKTTLSSAVVSGSLKCGTLCASVIDWTCQSNAANGAFQFPAPAQFDGGDVIIGNSNSRSASSGLTVTGNTELRQGLIVSGPSILSGVSTPSLNATTLTATGTSSLSDVTASGNLTVGGTLSTSNFVFQGQTIQVRNITYVTSVDFNNETVTTASVTVIGP